MTHVMPFLFLSVFAKNILIFMYKPRFLWYTINDTNTQGFDRRLSVRASSKDLRMPAYSLRLFPRPGKNPLGQNCKAPVGERFCDDFCCGQRRNIPIFRGGQCKKARKIFAHRLARSRRLWYTLLCITLYCRSAAKT